MNKFIPALTEVESRQCSPDRWKSEYFPQVKQAYKKITLTDEEKDLLLECVTGELSRLEMCQTVFNDIKALQPRFLRGYKFAYLVLQTAIEKNVLLDQRGIQVVYKALFEGKMHQCYTKIVANYCDIYMVRDADKYTPVVKEDHTENIINLLQQVSKSKRTNTESVSYNKEALTVSNMEFVFQYANEKSLLEDLMVVLQDSTPEEDFTRSVKMFSDKSMMYDFYQFMRSNGVALS